MLTGTMKFRIIFKCSLLRIMAGLKPLVSFIEALTLSLITVSLKELRRVLNVSEGVFAK